MFDFFKKPIDCNVYAPVNGTMLDIKDVPDKMFANKLLGDGVGFVFDGDVICSPIEGSITMIASTKHAFGVVSKSGLEILVHCGLDTVNLNGEGLNMLVEVGDKVKVGTPILEINRILMEEKNIDLTTPVIITNHKNFEFEIKNAVKDVECGKTLVISTVRK